MKFTVKNTVLAENLPQDIIKDVRNDLTITNPAFSKKMAMGLSVWGVKQYQQYYDMPSQGVIEIPVGYLPRLTNEILKRGYDAEDIEIDDKRTINTTKDFFSNLSFNATLRDYQEDMEKAALSHTVGVVQAKTGSGKCLGKGTKVLMFDGSVKKAEDIKIGDLLMGPDSTPRQVLSLARGREEMFRVKPVKGEPWECNKSHILSLRYSGNDVPSKGRYSGDTINMSVADYLSMDKTFRRNTKLYRVGVEYPQKDLIIDPYFLGIWLGDGLSLQPEITTEDPEVVIYLNKFASKNKLNVSKKAYKGKATNYRLVREDGETGRFRTNPLKDKLSSLGVLGNKHIPFIYLTSSRQQRLSLLAGLIDSDGHYSNNHLAITSKWKKLADQIRDLCRSLGLAAYTSVKSVKIKEGDIRDYYRVNISGDYSCIPTKIKRKKAKKRKQVKNVLHTGFTLESIGEGDYYGFEITGDRLFLLADYTVTHNTVTFVKIVVERGINTIILVNTKELAEQTVDAFVEFTNLEKDDIGFIGSGRYEKKPITIGILQTMRVIVEDDDPTKLNEINDYFGQSIADETHIIAAETYYNVMSNLNFKFKFGFSATPFREDGLTDVIHFANGPLIHQVPDEAVEDHLVIPGYKQLMTDYYFPLMDTSEYQTMITHMAEDKERNDFIIKHFEEIGKDLPSVFLCNRTSQVEYLHENIENSIMLTSKMSKTEREQAMEDLRSGKAIHVCSTFGLFSTGLDVPRLECLYIVSPMKSEIKLRQSAGRLMRKASGKMKAMIYDFIDKRIGLLYGQSRVRKRILTSL